VQRAEPAGDGIEYRVDLLRPRGTRPGERAGQAEHPAGVRQPHAQYLRAGGAQGADRVRGCGLDQARIETRPERVVDAENHAGDVGAQRERAR